MNKVKAVIFCSSNNTAMYGTGGFVNQTFKRYGCTDFYGCVVTLEGSYGSQFFHETKDADLAVLDAIDFTAEFCEEGYERIAEAARKIREINPSCTIFAQIIDGGTVAVHDVPGVIPVERFEDQKILDLISRKSKQKEDAMKILLVEDSKMHLHFALQQLEGHDVTIVENFVEAMGMLRSSSTESFDAVLTDLHLPRGADYCGVRGADDTTIAPFGQVIVLKALERGVKLIGLLTDAGHHDNLASRSLEFLGERQGRCDVFTVGDSRVLASIGPLCDGNFDVKTLRMVEIDKKLGGKAREDDNYEDECYEKDGIKFVSSNYYLTLRNAKKIASPKDYGKLLAKLLEEERKED